MQGLSATPALMWQLIHATAYLHSQEVRHSMLADFHEHSQRHTSLIADAFALMCTFCEELAQVLACCRCCCCREWLDAHSAPASQQAPAMPSDYNVTRAFCRSCTGTSSRRTCC